MTNTDENDCFYPCYEWSEDETTLARRLHYEIERLEIGVSGLGWEDLTDIERDLFFIAIGNTIRTEAAAVLNVLSANNPIGGGRHVGE